MTPPIRQLGKRKRCKKEILALRTTPAISIQANQPKTIMDSKGNGLAILMPRCGVDSKAYREFIKIEDCQKRVKSIMGASSKRLFDRSNARSY